MPTTSSMKAMIFRQPGGPEVLELASLPIPQPGSGEILVRVHAAGINRPEVLQRQGKYPIDVRGSAVLGLEIAGDVVAVGAGVEQWSVGDRVCALTNGGGYAEYAIAPAVQALPWPAGYDAIMAASLPETFFTVWANLFQMGHLRAGETVLIHGGAGGIGTTAIQLARAFQAKVIVTASSPEACRTCIELGANIAVNYKKEDFVEAVLHATDGKGVDVILDIIGAAYFQRNIASLAMDGRLILLGFLGGELVENVDLVKIMAKRLVITGSAMRPRTIAEKGNIAADLRAKVWPLLDSGACRPQIARVFPLAQAADAHRLMENGGYTGKIVLQTI